MFLSVLVVYVKFKNLFEDFIFIILSLKYLETEEYKHANYVKFTKF